MIHLIIYEDDKDLREGLGQFLSDSGEFSIEGMFSNCETIAIDLRELKADVLLMDIDMPGINGIEGVRIAKAAKPSISILMFTVFDDDKKIFDAICAGADGYILKKTLPEIVVAEEEQQSGVHYPSTFRKNLLSGIRGKQKYLGGTLLVGATFVANILNYAFNAYIGRHVSLSDFALLSVFSGLAYIWFIPFNAV